MSVSGQVHQALATWADGDTVSSVVDLGDRLLCGVYAPSGFPASAVTLQASPDNVATYGAVNRGTAEVSIDTAAGKTTLLAPADFAGLRFVKVILPSPASGARSLVLASRLF